MNDTRSRDYAFPLYQIWLESRLFTTVLGFKNILMCKTFKLNSSVSYFTWTVILKPGCNDSKLKHIQLQNGWNITAISQIVPHFFHPPLYRLEFKCMLSLCFSLLKNTTYKQCRKSWMEKATSSISAWTSMEPFQCKTNTSRIVTQPSQL